MTGAGTLWAPWRMEYILGPKAGECVFCAAASPGADRERLVLCRGDTALAVLNRYPYVAGHFLVLPRRHVAALEELTAEEAAELWALLVRVKGAVERLMRPQGYNIGFNLGAAAGAGIADHLHLHGVPRWAGDTNFMPLLGGTVVIPQHLTDTYDALVPLLGGGVGGSPARE